MKSNDDIFAAKAADSDSSGARLNIKKLIVQIIALVLSALAGGFMSSCSHPFGWDIQYYPNGYLGADAGVLPALGELPLTKTPKR